jgi:peptidyl-prolyl cis-trans isomerase D
MLKVLRDNIKYLSWILWAVILVFVLFVFVDFGSGVPGFSGQQAAATVGGVPVSYGEYQRAYRNLEARFRQLYGAQFTPEVAKQFGLARQAIEQLINEKVLVEEARRLGLATSDDELRETILSFPAFQDSQGRFVGGPAYESVLRANFYPSAEEFEREMREQILADKLRRALTAGLYLADGDVERAYRQEVERASIRFVQLPAQGPQSPPTVEVSPREAAAYLDAHRDRFRLPERRRVAYLLVDNAKLRDRVEIPPADLEAYYRDHPEEFTQEEQVRARHILLQVDDRRTADRAQSEAAEIRRRIAGGEDFAVVAREVSEDPESAARGGDLGYFGRGRMTPEFEQAAFAASPGELVGPVSTPFGVHLLEVTDRRAGGLQPLDQARPRIQARLLAERVQEAGAAKAAEIAAQLRAQGEVTVDRLRAAAGEDPATSFDQTPPLGRDDAVPGIGRGGDFAAAAFALEPGKVSDPVRVPRGNALLAVEEVLAPRDPQLAEVEAEVRQAVEGEKRQQAAMDRLAAARADVAAGRVSFDQAAADLGLPIEESGEFGAGGSIPGIGVSPRIAAAALGMKEGEIGGPFGTARGAVLFEVTARKSWDPATFAAEREATRERLEREQLNRLLGSLIERRRAELGVTYDRELHESLAEDGAGAGAA